MGFPKCVLFLSRLMSALPASNVDIKLEWTVSNPCILFYTELSYVSYIISLSLSIVRTGFLSFATN